jgi:hypothetical protein
VILKNGYHYRKYSFDEWFVNFIYPEVIWMNMIHTLTKTCILLAIGALFFLTPVCAVSYNIVPTGGTVFIGEQGLDISGPVGAVPVTIGWWTSGASVAANSPDYTVDVSTPTNFYVSPMEFGSRTGSWYVLPAKTLAFNVADPQLDIKVEDTTVNVDVTDKWVPTDDELQFRIDNNLVPISQRTGVTSFPITIKVQSPDGAVYTSLVNNGGTKTPIVDYQITSTRQYILSNGPIWGVSRDTYPPGTYTIWAECNVNSMNDNYNVVGKTISKQISLLNQDQNPLIGNKGYVTNPTTQITLVPTTKITTIVTPAPTTLKTSPPTTVVPTVLPETTAVNETPTTSLPTTSLPTTAHTKSPGFEASIVVVAMFLGLVFFFKK